MAVPNLSNSLPPELLFSIFKYLPEKDILSIVKVCKVFKQIADDRQTWQALGESFRFRKENCNKDEFIAYKEFFKQNPGKSEIGIAKSYGIKKYLDLPLNIVERPPRSIANYIQCVPIERYKTDYFEGEHGLSLRVRNHAYEPPRVQNAFFAEFKSGFLFGMYVPYANADLKSVDYVIRLLAGEPCGSWATTHLGMSPIEGKRSLADGRSVVQLI